MKIGSSLIPGVLAEDCEDRSTVRDLMNGRLSLNGERLSALGGI